jgi:hypothetical protein
MPVIRKSHNHYCRTASTCQPAAREQPSRSTAYGPDRASTDRPACHIARRSMGSGLCPTCSPRVPNMCSHDLADASSRRSDHDRQWQILEWHRAHARSARRLRDRSHAGKREARRFRRREDWPATPIVHLPKPSAFGDHMSPRAPIRDQTGAFLHGIMWSRRLLSPAPAGVSRGTILRTGCGPRSTDLGRERGLAAPRERTDWY